MIVNSGNLTLLYRGFSTAFRDGFGQAPADHEPFTLTVPSMTAEEEYGFLGQAPGLKKWVGERVLRGIAEHGYAIENELYENTVEVKRKHIEDDRYGVYAPLFNELGRAAGAHPCELVYQALKDGFSEECYDGQYFFDSDHPVEGASVSNTGGGAGTAWFLVDGSRMLKPIIFQRRTPAELVRMDDMRDEHAFMRDTYRYGVRARHAVGYGLWQTAYGSKQALNAAAYGAAREAMMAFKGDEGRPMGIRPTHLIVPPALEKEALEILSAERLANGATNVYRGTATAIVTPWLA